MYPYQAKELLQKYKTGTCTAEEKAIVESWHIKEIASSDFMPDEEELERVGQSIWAALPVHENQYARSRTRHLWMRYAAAAILFCTAITIFYIYAGKTDKSKLQMSQVERFKNDIKPGGNKAILVLASGQTVTLDDAGAGVLAHEGETGIRKTAEGKLVYEHEGKKSQVAVLTNKLSTPKGGQYQVRLSDGTKVWLNSASTLVYPAVFNGINREVELSGEAYFEVAKNKLMPFVVHSNKQSVQVLGTHFNINSYPSEESIKTTLIEGSVQVSSGGNTCLLKPGQQAENTDGIRVKKADTEQVLSWLNNDFNFKDENIESIMRKLERWYDITVVYEGKISEIDYGAEISRSKTLVQVLKILEKTGSVHFKIEGRRVTVMP